MFTEREARAAAEEKTAGRHFARTEHNRGEETEARHGRYID